MSKCILLLTIGMVTTFCSHKFNNIAAKENTTSKDSMIRPLVITQQVLGDSDDPAIWIDKKNPANSFILGTDKDNKNGGVYAFNLKGQIIPSKTITHLNRVNNIDIAYGFRLDKATIDLAVATERGKNTLRVFSLPDMKIIDGGGINVFEDQIEDYKKPMGIALYTRPSDGVIFAIVSRKTGESGAYLYQYQLVSEKGRVAAKLVRKFGAYSGKKEIESIAVDNELGYVYYSDEQAGIRKYYADPAKGNDELALFGQGDFKEDNEGISIYKLDGHTGYILVSNQQANTFNVYPREGTTSNPHQHLLIGALPLQTQESDGSDVTSFPIPGFKGGLFVAMSTDRTFQLYQWADVAKYLHLKIK